MSSNKGRPGRVAPTNYFYQLSTRIVYIMSTRDLIRSVIPFIVALAVIGLIWKLYSLTVPSYLLPPPEQVFERLSKSINDPKFYTSIGRSLARLGGGFAIAVAVGVSVGLLSSTVKAFREYARAFLAILQSVPPIAYLPLLILILGFGDKSVLWVITLAALFPIAINALSAVEQVNQVYLAAAKNLGANPRQVATRVYLPNFIWILKPERNFYQFENSFHWPKQYPEL